MQRCIELAVIVEQMLLPRILTVNAFPLGKRTFILWEKAQRSWKKLKSPSSTPLPRFAFWPPLLIRSLTVDRSCTCFSSWSTSFIQQRRLELLTLFSLSIALTDFSHLRAFRAKRSLSLTQVAFQHVTTPPAGEEHPRQREES